MIGEPGAPGQHRAGGGLLIVRAGLLFVAVYAVTTLAILNLVSLPEIRLLRYVAFALPVLVSIILVVAWVELGAPWPARSMLWHSGPRRDRRAAPGTQPIRSRAG